MWMDQRSYLQVKKLEDRIGEMIFRITFNKVNPTWTLPQLLWVQENEPEVLRRTERLFFTKDYLRYRLCGTWETDYIDAQGSMFFDGLKREWNRDLIREVGLSPTALPPVVKPTTICGEVTLQAARETGLREGTPVIVGTSDTAAEDYGAGAIEPGQGIIKMATAGNVCIMSDRPRPTPAGFNYPHVVEGLWYIVAGTNSCASANRWYRDALCRWEVEKAKSKGESAFRRMDEMAAKAPLGAEGLFFHPYLMGERSPYFDPYLRASFVGATMGHQKEHFSRAVLEGVAYSLLDASRVIKDLGQEVRDLRLIGGGAKSPLWRQILADVMGMPVLIPSAGDASFGSALLAGVGIGLFADPQTAVRQGVQYDALVQPNRQNHEKYQKYFSIYQKIHDQLASINRTIHESLAER
jgi:xylulokinase